MLVVKDMSSGVVFEQETPFDSITRDWNNDGDVYPIYGAYFTSRLGREFISKGHIGKDNYFEIVK